MNEGTLLSLQISYILLKLFYVNERYRPILQHSELLWAFTVSEPIK